MAAAAPTRRILMLHGYSQNAYIFSKRMGAVRKQCGKSVDFVFIDAPHVLKGAEILSSEAPAEVGTTADPAMAPRGWWTHGPDWKQCFGLEESVIALRDVLKTGKFDGIFGFSQGAAMAAMVAALLENPQKHPSFLVDGQPPHPPLQFCIAASGFVPNDPTGKSFVSPRFDTPTLHVMGEADQLVINERSMALVNMSTNSRVEVHDGGHFVPSKANWRRFFKDYINDPLGNIPSPATTSAAPSGTATPVSS